MTAAGMRPAILRLAAENGTSEEIEWRCREDEALKRLAAAQADLSAYRGAITDGLLPALTTTPRGTQ